MRLVDADSLIDRLNERKSREQGIRNIADILRVKSFIEEQPTAYDIDKVVKELYEKRTEILLSNDYECEIINYCIDNFDKAIKIVKQDDISDDMCEWRKFKDNGCLFETSCGNISGMYRGFNFCPYCGKKIKKIKVME